MPAPKTLRQIIEETRSSGRKGVKIYFTEDLESSTAKVVPELAESVLDDGIEVKVKGIVESLKRGLEEAARTGKGVLTRIEAIHVGLTRNLTYYTEEGLRNSVPTWTRPYEKPILTHHNKYGEPVGRVKEARYNSQSMLSAGRGCIEVLCEITDPDAKAKLADGRYSTVSIGAETDSIKCSICHTDFLNEGFCEHEKGNRYNEKGELDPHGQLCYWIVGSISGDEISFVNIPSDSFAMATGISESTAVNTESVTEGASSGTPDPEGDRRTKEGADVTMPEGLPESLLASAELVALIEASPETLRTYINTVLKAVVDMQNESKTTIDSLTVEKAQLEQEKTDLSEKVTSLETTNAELNEKVSTMTSEQEAHVAEAAQWQSEREQLLAENTRIAEEWRNNLIDRIIESRMALGKDTEESKDETIAKLSARPSEYLLYCLQDLAEETSRLGVVDPVQNPGLVKSVNENGTEVKTEEANKPKEITYKDLAEATAGLFRGPGLSRKSNKSNK